MVSFPYQGGFFSHRGTERVRERWGKYRMKLMRTSATESVWVRAVFAAGLIGPKGFCDPQATQNEGTWERKRVSEWDRERESILLPWTNKLERTCCMLRLLRSLVCALPSYLCLSLCDLPLNLVPSIHVFTDSSNGKASQSAKERERARKKDGEARTKEFFSLVRFCNATRSNFRILLHPGYPWTSILLDPRWTISRVSH